MIDDERTEHFLRAHPARDATYEPALADLLDAAQPEALGSGVLRWRQGDPALARLIPLVLIVGAVLIAATAMFVGSRRDDPLVIVEAPRPPATVEAIPDFPTDEVSAVLSRFTASNWPTAHGVIADIAILHGDRVWAAISTKNAAATLGEGSWPGQTTVRIGATEHVFVAGAVLLLVDSGRLDIDAPVSRYLTDWPAVDGITVRHLLDGSSGLAAFGEPVEDLADLVAAETARTWTAADALRIARQRATRFEAGARHAPVDTEDVLLVAIIESATGMSGDGVVGQAFSALYPPPPDAPVPDAPIDPSAVIGAAPNAGLWDPTGSGDVVEVTDLPPDVVAVLGPGRGRSLSVSQLAGYTHGFRADPLLLSGSSRASLGRTFEDDGVGGIAMCPCTGSVQEGVGLVGHTGPYTALVVYVPSKDLTISIVVNAAVDDDVLQRLLQEVYEEVWPAIH